MNTCKRTALLLLIIFGSLQLKAQNKELPKPPITPWYVGIKAGVPLGVSTFTSLGDGNTRLGYSFGALAGYQYNSIFSLELSAMFGNANLSSSSRDANYWLGSDGIHYLSPVVGEQGYYYRDLYSSLLLQQYGLHLNINLLPIFNYNTDSRFSVLLSPAIYGIGTRATIKTIADDKQFIENKSQFNFGVGGDVTVGYRLTDNLAVRLSSGVNYAVGRSFDGVPVSEAKTNLIWNNDISVTWRFGRRKIKASKITSTPGIAFQTKTHATTAAVAIEDIEEVVFTEKIDIIATGENGRQISFPAIYFAFNSADVTSAQMGAIDQVVQLLNDNSKVEIILSGFTDKYGSDEINKRYARRRTETVESLLIKRGIDASRIKTIGVGVDINAQTTREACSVDINMTVIIEKEAILDVKTDIVTTIERKSIDQNVVLAKVKPTKERKSIDQNVVVAKVKPTKERKSIYQNVVFAKVQPTKERKSIYQNVALAKVMPTKEQELITFPSIYFGFSSQRIASTQTSAVDEIVRMLNENPEVRIDIMGVVNRAGLADMNKRVSQKIRANYLQDILIKKGIDASRIITVSVEVDESAKTEIETRRVDVIMTPSSNILEAKPLIVSTTYFDINDVRVSPTQSNTVAEIVNMLSANPEMSVTITGFSEQTTPKEVNQQILNEFQDMLVKQGVKISRIKIPKTNTSTIVTKAITKKKNFATNYFESNDKWVSPKDMTD